MILINAIIHYEVVLLFINVRLCMFGIPHEGRDGYSLEISQGSQCCFASSQTASLLCTLYLHVRRMYSVITHDVAIPESVSYGLLPPSNKPAYAGLLSIFNRGFHIAGIPKHCKYNSHGMLGTFCTGLRDRMPSHCGNDIRYE